MSDAEKFPNAFRPITVGTMQLEHRFVVPPHGAGIGSMLGSERQYEEYAAYWGSKITGGFQWIGGGPTFVANPLIPGFEPTGIGANGPGVFRHRSFSERLGRFADHIHGLGGFLSVQFVQQGGMPSAPSQTLSGYFDHKIPHALSNDEVRWLINEYGESAGIAAAAGIDAIELHANHDDVIQWFLSPLTNRRSDDYGGDFEGRRRFLREIVESIRAHVDRPITLGLRLCIDEQIEGGYGLDTCQQLLAAFTEEGLVDYFSLDVGNNWGKVSYIQPGLYAEGEWAALCGEAKAATTLPVVYVGRVGSVETAERILADGQADLVGFVRASMADPELVVKAKAGRVSLIRPCVGLNECIDKRILEGTEFGCAVNPQTGRELSGGLPRTTDPKSVLVVGGGPAGTELAALAAERGHHVRLWERDEAIGGQIAIAAIARSNARYRLWVDWQAERLGRLGVDVKLGYEADAAAVLDAGADIVVVATGARPRVVDVPGAELAVTAAAALKGAPLGRRVAVISEDDRAAPLTVADHLAALGHEVTLVHRTPAPSPLVGKYTLGALLARLDEGGVRVVPSSRLVGIEPGVMHLANSFSDRRFSVDGIDTVVLATGALSEDGLFQAVRHRHPAAHLLGDAFAPRRMVYATRQAYILATTLD